MIHEIIKLALIVLACRGIAFLVMRWRKGMKNIKVIAFGLLFLPLLAKADFVNLSDTFDDGYGNLTPRDNGFDLRCLSNCIGSHWDSYWGTAIPFLRTGDDSFYAGYPGGMDSTPTGTGTNGAMGLYPNAPGDVTFQNGGYWSDPFWVEPTNLIGELKATRWEIKQLILWIIRIGAMLVGIQLFRIGTHGV